MSSKKKKNYIPHSIRRHKAGTAPLTLVDMPESRRMLAAEYFECAVFVAAGGTEAYTVADEELMPGHDPFIMSALSRVEHIQ